MPKFQENDLVRITQTTAKGRTGRIKARENLLLFGEQGVGDRLLVGYVLDSDSPDDPLWPEECLEKLGEIRLPLRDIYSAPAYPKDRLEQVEHPLTEEDFDSYDRSGWKYFRPENHIEHLLPSLGVSLHFHRTEAVVPIKGQNYRVRLECDYEAGEPYEPDGKTLVLTPTDEPATKPVHRGDGRPQRQYYCKYFGQPRWVQGEYYPADLKGEPCSHFLTVENGWGDAGNWNILLGFDEAGVPNVAYFEASCC